MNDIQRFTTGVVCLVDNDVERRALIYAVSLRLGLRFECDEQVHSFQPCMQSARPACLLIAEQLLPKLGSTASPANGATCCTLNGHDFTSNHLATIVLGTQPSVSDVVNYMRCGAVAVLAEPLDPEAIAHWIHEALRVDQQRFQNFCRAQELAKTYSLFSRRKQLVLRHMIDGRASKWSAHDLDVSRRTIELDRAEILTAFGASNAIELARFVGPWLDKLHWETPHVSSPVAQLSNSSN